MTTENPTQPEDGLKHLPIEAQDRIVALRADLASARADLATLRRAADPIVNKHIGGRSPMRGDIVPLVDAMLATDRDLEAALVATEAADPEIAALAERVAAARNGERERMLAASRASSHYMIAALRADLASARAECERLQLRLTSVHQMRDHIATENASLRASHARAVGAFSAISRLLEHNGCDCICDHGGEEHDDGCEPRCLACRIEACMPRLGADPAAKREGGG